MIHRSRFGWSTGDHAITYTFFRSLKSEIVRHSPDKVYIVSEGKPIHRIAINPDYKGNRKAVTDDGFHRQKKDIFEICKYLPITFIKHPEYECDDVIGHLSSKVHKNENVVICSSDSDFIQLLENPNTTLWNPVRKKFIEQWPVNYLVWKALRGDKTDNVQGIKGVGDKTAMKLAKDKDQLEKFLTEDKRKAFDKAYAQIKLSDIDKDCNKFIKTDYTFSVEELFKAFSDRSFNSIIEKGWSKWKTTMEELNDKQEFNRI